MADTTDNLRKRALTREDIMMQPDGQGPLQRVLGTTERDVGSICINANINAASKCKPIKYNKPEALTDAERLGMTFENSEGYYYGVNMKADARLTDIHTVGYEYSRPNGNPYWYRLTDFIGYHHLARPNVDAYIISEPIYVDLENSMLTNYNVDYLGTNRTGIDIKAVFAKIAGNQDMTYVFARVYPIIAVDSKASVLKDENGVIHPIYWQNAWHTVFYANLANGDFGAGRHQVTLGYMFQPSSVGSTFPIDGSWVDISITAGGIYTESVIVAYSTHGAWRDFSTYHRYAPKATPALNVNSRFLFISYTFASNPASSVVVTAYVTYGATRVDVSETYDPNASGTISIGLQVKWRELGIVPVVGQQYLIGCRINTRYENDTVVTVGDDVSQLVTITL